jgi:hypothetical protein
LNGAETPRLALRRFLDGEDVAQIEFEAEISGFAELARQARSRLRKLSAMWFGVSRGPAPQGVLFRFKSPSRFSTTEAQ